MLVRDLIYSIIVVVCFTFALINHLFYEQTPLVIGILLLMICILPFVLLFLALPEIFYPKSKLANFLTRRLFM